MFALPVIYVTYIIILKISAIRVRIVSACGHRSLAPQTNYERTRKTQTAWQVTVIEGVPGHHFYVESIFPSNISYARYVKILVGVQVVQNTALRNPNPHSQRNVSVVGSADTFPPSQGTAYSLTYD